MVNLTAIGTGDRALYCLTNLMECCRNGHTPGDSALGDWKHPDLSIVFGSSAGNSHPFYTTRGLSAVALNHRNKSVETTGIFTCEVPDAGGVTRSLYILISVGQAPGTHQHFKLHLI